MLKILQARLQQYMNCELPGVQAGFRKGRGTRDQIAQYLLDHEKTKRVPEKNTSSLLSAIKVVSSVLSEVIDISSSKLDSSFCIIQPSISHDVLCM